MKIIMVLKYLLLMISIIMMIMYFYLDLIKRIYQYYIKIMNILVIKRKKY